jgi:transaldolase
VQDAIARARKTRNVEIIWASTREVFNVVEADDMGCHIITAPAEVLKKLPAIGTKSAAELRWRRQILPRRCRCRRPAACGSGSRAAE